MVAQLNAVFGQVVHAHQLTASVLTQFHDRSNEFGGRQDRCAHHGLVDLSDFSAGELTGVGDGDLFAIVHHYAVHHVRCGRDQCETGFALETLAHDFKVKQTKEATTKSKTQRNGSLGFVHQRRIVELQFV